jgi:serine/threonine protein kinase
MLIYGPNIDRLSPDEIYKLCPVCKSPVKRVDGTPVEPHAPPYSVHPLRSHIPANRLIDPRVKISDYGTSFVVADKPSPKLHTPSLYLPPEDFFGEPVTPAADVWTLGVNLYEVLGERPLFETFAWDHDDIIAEMVSTLGQLPQRWWDKWANRSEFFEYDGS